MSTENKPDAMKEIEIKLFDNSGNNLKWTGYVVSPNMFTLKEALGLVNEKLSDAGFRTDSCSKSSNGDIVSRMSNVFHKAIVSVHESDKEEKCDTYNYETILEMYDLCK